MASFNCQVAQEYTASLAISLIGKEEFSSSMKLLNLAIFSVIPAFSPFFTKFNPATTEYEYSSSARLLNPSIAGKSYIYYINEIPGLGKLKILLMLHISTEENVFVIENSDLGIIETGEDEQSALQEFYIYFKGVYDILLHTPEQKLSKRALELKEKYLTYLPNVEHR
jgi:hypothetical protein